MIHVSSQAIFLLFFLFVDFKKTESKNEIKEKKKIAVSRKTMKNKLTFCLLGLRSVFNTHRGLIMFLLFSSRFRKHSNKIKNNKKFFLDLLREEKKGEFLGCYNSSFGLIVFLTARLL